MCWGHPESQRWVVPPESTLHWRARASAWDRTSGLLMTGMPPCCEAPLLSSFAGAWAMHSSHCRCARRWKRGKRLANCCFVSKMSRLWTHVPSLEKRRTRARGIMLPESERACPARGVDPRPIQEGRNADDCRSAAISASSALRSETTACTVVVSCRACALSLSYCVRRGSVRTLCGRARNALTRITSRSSSSLCCIAASICSCTRRSLVSTTEIQPLFAVSSSACAAASSPCRWAHDAQSDPARIFVTRVTRLRTQDSGPSTAAGLRRLCQDGSRKGTQDCAFFQQTRTSVCLDSYRARQQKHKSIKHRRWRGECSQAEPGRLALPGARGASAAHGEQRL